MPSERGSPGPFSPDDLSGDGRSRELAWPPGFVATRADRRALLVLASLQGIRPRRLLELAVRLGTARACLAAVADGREGSEADRRWVRRIDPDRLEASMGACGARVAFPGSPEYSPWLGDLADPPAALFVRGAPLQPAAARVAVVGARRCSSLGREVATEIGAGLAGAGITVVSGAAMGIDAAAHEGALRAGGHTIAVLGCGIDQSYPPRNQALIDRIAASGSVVSEYPPGVPAEPFRFPARNRIIAALAEAVVVVEGARGSGSLITADHALDLGRAVYAVPGPVTSPLSEVPLALIRDGAGMIRGAEDLLVDLGRIDPEAARASLGGGGLSGEGGAASGEGLSDGERAVLGVLAGPTLPDQVAASLGWELGEVIPVLVSLELRGLVRNVGGRVERRLVVTS
ncbi:MAG: DNA-processing protein DprA [Actinomycetota bacterium]|nr:DNA-processing protein DprA [Actinomycetota bacterium]